MRDFIFLSTIAILIFSLSNIVAAKKHDAFRYEDTSGTFAKPDDWFGKMNVTRKQMEMEEEERQSEARKNMVEQRKAWQDAQALNQEAPGRKTPAIERTSMKNDKNGLTSAIKTGSLINADIQQGRRSLHEREGNYPGDPPSQSYP